MLGGYIFSARGIIPMGHSGRADDRGFWKKFRVVSRVPIVADFVRGNSASVCSTIPEFVLPTSPRLHKNRIGTRFGTGTFLPSFYWRGCGTQLWAAPTFVPSR